jgi:Ca-activated chloride channel homolog
MLNAVKYSSHKTLLCSAILLLVLFGGVKAEKPAQADSDRTLSPFFFVQSDDATDRLPLKSTAAEATISGVIADVEVTQVYKNEGKNTLEAIYIFPGSTRSAVYAMRMTIGKRTIEAKIQEREAARQTYEKALSEGKTASLLEQQRPNVFQMNVGNILPGDEIVVKLNYTEVLVPQDGTYEFVYPTVVGPRYSNQPSATAGKQDKWVANPYLEEGKDAPFTFTFSCKINCGMPIARLTSPSHEIDVEYTGKNSAHIGLKESNKTNNRDVLIQYSLSGDSIESGLLLNIGKTEDFFLLMLEPPKRVESAMIVPREYIFVVDVSGSMHGFPLEVAKTLMKDLLGNLRPTDFFNVMCFSGGNTVLSPRSLPANAANVQKAIDALDSRQGGGGTELMPALRNAMALPRAEENISRSMIVVTDGYVAVEKEAFDYIRSNLNKGNVFAFGIGNAVNRFLIEGMARAGMGEPFIIQNGDDAIATAKKFREYIDSPVLTDIQVKFNGLNVSEVEPPSIPDLFAKKPVVFFGKYSGTPQGTIVITGKTAGKPYKQEIRVSEGKVSTTNKALRYLWARHRIIRLADMVKLERDDKRIKEVTDLGLTYNLLTDYTSFVAVDNEVRTQGKPRETVKQPLPLPQGVSNYAVGGQMSPAPGMMSPAQAPMRSFECVKELKKSKSKEENIDQEITKLQKQLERAPAEEKTSLSEQVTDGKATSSHTTKGCLIKVKKIDGQLDKAVVDKAIAMQLGDITRLVEAEGKAGEYKVEIVVDADGKVSKVDIKKDTFRNDSLKEQIVKLLSAMTFGSTKDGKQAKVVLTVTVGK